MLDDLKPKIQDGEAKSLLKRLESKKRDQALPAEAELALLWALYKATSINTWPTWPNVACRIEATAEDLFKSQPAAIEITAISDFSFSGKEAMNQVAEKFVSLANSLRKNSGKHLFFEFAESSFFENGNFKRIRHVPKKYKLEKDYQTLKFLEAWLKHPDWPKPDRIRIQNEKLDVTITWKKYVHPENRTFCTMPAVAYDLQDNPLFRRLKEKEKEQLSKVPKGYLKCLFITDVGCELIKNLKGFGSIWEFSGEKIIQHFLSRSSIDVVCVFSPFRHSPLGYSSELKWKVSVYDRRSAWPNDEHKGLEKVASFLPIPRFEGYQAQSLHRQGSFASQKNKWYLDTEMIIPKGVLDPMTIKVSSRLVLDLLAGRTTTEIFQQEVFGKNQNQFEHEQNQGFTIKSSHIEPGGIDEDDDYLVFELSPDPAASKFHL
ncbi:MAG: hypothetical protein F3745_02655 [Nitrospinae bacterium]|nr:hypothetical protein [Nitrospinota bacterium]